MPSLSSHPVFNTPNGTYSSLQNTARRNVVAFKGTEVYLAVGSAVRCADLREWYAMDTEPQDDKSYYQVSPRAYGIADYQTLQFPSLTFPIEELVWNYSGTQLACVGAHNLAVIMFPRLGLSSHIKADSIPPKSVTFIDPSR